MLHCNRHVDATSGTIAGTTLTPPSPASLNVTLPALPLFACLQEVSTKLTEEARDARVEAGILRRQHEALEKLAVEAR